MPATYSKSVSTVVTYKESSFSVSSTSKSSTPAIGGASLFRSFTSSPRALGFENGSPHWISGSEAVFKTPKSPSPANQRRRTEMILPKGTAGKRMSVNADFKIPSLMFGSPPGVKTRSRRSSIYVSAQKSSKGESTASTVKRGGPVKRAGKSVPSKAQTKLTAAKVVISDVMKSNASEAQLPKKNVKAKEVATKAKFVKKQSPAKKKGVKLTAKVTSSNDSFSSSVRTTSVANRPVTASPLSLKLTSAGSQKKSASKKSNRKSVKVEKSKVSGKKGQAASKITSSKRKSRRRVLDQANSSVSEMIDSTDLTTAASPITKNRKKKSPQLKKSPKIKRLQGSKSLRKAGKRLGPKLASPSKKTQESSAETPVLGVVTPRRKPTKKSPGSSRKSVSAQSVSTQRKTVRSSRNISPSSTSTPVKTKSPAVRATPKKSEKRKQKIVKHKKTVDKVAETSVSSSDIEMAETVEDSLTPVKSGRTTKSKSSNKKQKVSAKRSTRRKSTKGDSGANESSATPKSALKRSRKKLSTSLKLSQPSSVKKRRSGTRSSHSKVLEIVQVAGLDSRDTSSGSTKRSGKSPTNASELSMVEKTSGKSRSPAKKTGKKVSSPRKQRSPSPPKKVSLNASEVTLEKKTPSKLGSPEIKKGNKASPVRKQKSLSPAKRKSPEKLREHRETETVIMPQDSSGKAETSRKRRSTKKVTVSSPAKKQRKAVTPSRSRTAKSLPSRRRKSEPASKKRISSQKQTRGQRTSQQTKTSVSVNVVQSGTTESLFRSEKTGLLKTPKVKQSKSASSAQKITAQEITPKLSPKITSVKKGNKSIENASLVNSSTFKQKKLSDRNAFAKATPKQSSRMTGRRSLTSTPVTPRVSAVSASRIVSQTSTKKVPQSTPRRPVRDTILNNQQKDEQAESSDIDKVISATFRTPHREGNRLVQNTGTPSIVVTRASPGQRTSTVQAREEMITVTSRQGSSTLSPARLGEIRYDSAARSIPSASRITSQASPFRNLDTSYTQRNQMLSADGILVAESSSAAGQVTEEVASEASFFSRRNKDSLSSIRRITEASPSRILQSSYTRRNRDSPSSASLTTAAHTSVLTGAKGVGKGIQQKFDVVDAAVASRKEHHLVASQTSSAKMVRESYRYSDSQKGHLDLSPKLTGSAQHNYLTEEFEVSQEEDGEEDESVLDESAEKFEESNDEIGYDDMAYAHTTHSQKCTIL